MGTTLKPLDGGYSLSKDNIMKLPSTCLVTIVEQNADMSLGERLTEAQKELVRFVAKEAVGEYIRETQHRDADPGRKTIKAEIPEMGFLRLPEVLSFIPLGKTCWWEGVRSGRFPKPVKLSARCSGWKAEDIRALAKSMSDQRREE